VGSGKNNESWHPWLCFYDFVSVSGRPYVCVLAGGRTGARVSPGISISKAIAGERAEEGDEESAPAKGR